MQSTSATVLRKVVRVQPFADINGETVDRIDGSGDRKARDDAVENSSGDAVDQTSAKHVIAGYTAKGRTLRNARCVNHMPLSVSLAVARLCNMRGFVCSEARSVRSSARTAVNWAGLMVWAAETNGTSIDSAVRSPDTSASSPSVTPSSTDAARPTTAYVALPSD